MKRLLFLVLSGSLIASSALAGPTPHDGGASLQAVLNSMTQGPSPGASSTNVLTDYISNDAYWSIHGSGGSVNTLIVEVASWASTNTFGIFDRANPGNRVQLFGGGASTGSQTLLSILDDGSVIVNFVDSGTDFAGNAFGYYIDSTRAPQPWTGGVWYSDSGLNVDGQDHMAAYPGKGIDTIQIPPYAPGIWDTDEYILAFEDLHAMHWGNQNGINDGYPEWSDVEPDYSDFVVIVESVDPTAVPVPGAVLLGTLGTGLVGWMRRRRTL